MNPRIVCAAIRHKDGRIVCGPRHYDNTMISVLDQFNDIYDWNGGRTEQGFINQFGGFYTREEAWAIADAEGQIIRDRDWMTGMLHSEHLY